MAAEPDGTTGLPASSLKPPRGEIQPSWWEQHGTLVILGTVAVIGLVAVVVWLVFRPKPPPPPIPSAEQAREKLEPLRHQPEDGALLSKTSQIVHGYISSVFGIPPVQLTTSEFCQAVVENQAIGPDLAREIGEFLRECDVRKFAPKPPSVPFGAVARSLAIIEHAESRLVELRRAATAGPPSTPHPSPSSGVAEQIASKS
ncbi:MAG TPA: hypothetical protein VFE51_19535 [Verrucomicrobiae bacterium]|nr:hypothetical protein [Verrucomicrobiae bacterium]